MGSQQILMIVIGVIVVGAAIAMGFVMFNAGVYSSNKSAIATDLQDFSMKTVQYWKTPASMGGAGQLLGNISIAGAGASLGFSEESSVYTFSNQNGEYRVLSLDGNGLLKIGALGVAEKGGKHPYAEATIDLLTQDTETTISEAESFPSP